jgi:hypothetical protein
VDTARRMMSFSCAHLPFSTKAVAPEKLQGEAELPLFFWGTGRLVTGPISHKQQFFFFFFLAFWSKQCDQSLFHLLGFLPSYSRRCFFGGSLRAVGIKHVCGDENLQYPAEMYSVIHRAKGKEGMDGRRARNGVAERAVLIFLLKVAILFPLLARVGLPTQFTLLEAYQRSCPRSWNWTFPAEFVF